MNRIAYEYANPNRSIYRLLIAQIPHLSTETYFKDTDSRYLGKLKSPSSYIGLVFVQII
jgi:hypothetical protein